MPTAHFPPYPRVPHSSGQARIRLDGKRVYLGKHQSPESHARYDALRNDWQRRQSVDRTTLTIDELCLRFLDHAKTQYVKGDRQTAEVACMRSALRPLVAECGTMLARDFGPLKLKTVRQSMIANGLCRKTINKHVHRIRLVFRWAVENELVPQLENIEALSAVSALKRGKSKAVESEPVAPVDDDRINAVRPFVSRQVWGMIQLQLRTGARPGEIVSMRTSDLTTGEVWEYRPREHKTEHHDKKRVVVIGPLGQAILGPFLSDSLSDPEAFVFSPVDAESERRRAQRRERKTPLRPNAVVQCAADGMRRPKARYSVASYRRAIERGCELAFGMPEELRKIPAALTDDEKGRRRSRAAEWRRANCWHPNQLRHSAATFVRQEFGLDGAQAILGHATADVTQVYAELTLARAREIAARIL